jgi:hypothetical protein
VVLRRQPEYGLKSDLSTVVWRAANIATDLQWSQTRAATETATLMLRKFRDARIRPPYLANSAYFVIKRGLDLTLATPDEALLAGRPKPIKRDLLPVTPPGVLSNSNPESIKPHHLSGLARDNEIWTMAVDSRNGTEDAPGNGHQEDSNSRRRSAPSDETVGGSQTSFKRQRTALACNSCRTRKSRVYFGLLPCSS